MKILTFALILYLAYRVIIKPALLGTGRKQQKRPLEDQQRNPSGKRTTTTNNANTEGEYIDYEEVD